MPEKEIAKNFVSGLKPDLFREEIYARSCETLQEAMDESRAQLSTYREFLEFGDRVKKPDVKKDKRDQSYSAGVAKRTADTKASGGSYPNIAKKTPGNSAKAVDMAEVECYRCHKKGHYANKCPEAKAKDSKGVFKARKMEEPVADKLWMSPSQSVKVVSVSRI